MKFDRSNQNRDLQNAEPKLAVRFWSGTQKMRRQSLVRHVFAAILCFLALGLTLSIAALLGNVSPFMLFHLAVIVAAWFGGFGAGVSATAFSVVLVWYAHLPPKRSFVLEENFHIVNLTAYTFVSIFVSAIVEALHSSIERARNKADEFQKMFDLSAVGVFQRNVRTSEIVRANHQFSVITGYDVNQVVGRRLEDVIQISPGSGGEHQLTIPVDAPMADWNIERQVIKKDGSHVWVRINGSFIHRTDDEEDITIEMIEDITEEKEHALELEKRVKERTSELQESNDALQQFCYSVAHDLRSPVRTVLVFAGLLGRECGTVLNAAGSDYFQRMVNAAQKMDKLIVDLLNFGRVSHQAVPLDRVSLREQVESVIASLENEIRDKGALVRANGPFPDVSGNGAVVHQILVNLVSNALKFVRKGVTPEIIITSEDRDGFVRLWIKDNGIGIRHDQHERIFDLFQRLDPNEEFSGTGIGLSIVKKGVERMKGQVGVQSEAGKGSSFWFELPKISGDSSLANGPLATPSLVAAETQL